MTGTGRQARMSRPPGGHVPGDTPATLRRALGTFLRHPSPRVLLAAVLVAVPLRLAAGGWSPGDALVAALILAAWPVQEWLIHVHILHWHPRRLLGRRMDPAVSRDHRRHHADPWRLDLVFIPMHTYAWTLPLVVGLWWLVMPTLPLTLTALGTYFLLALHYEWTHYLAHIRYCPPLRYYRRRVRQHRLHHFRHERLWWGVSMGGGDRLFRTAPHPAGVEPSPTRFEPGLKG